MNQALTDDYLFDDKFGRPAKGNDKGHAEGGVGCGRRNFMVPIPRFESFEALNAWLEEQCLRRQNDIVRGHDVTIGERLLCDLDALMALPKTSEVYTKGVERWKMAAYAMRTLETMEW